MVIVARTSPGLGLTAVVFAADLKANAEQAFIVVASTTFTDDSRFFDNVLPIFETESGIDVRVVVVGTGGHRNSKSWRCRGAVRLSNVAFEKIAKAEAVLVSRDDDSGTHKEELETWKDAGVAAEEATGTWYREIGQGIAPTLNTEAGMDAYILGDRGTWISFSNSDNLEALLEGDPNLINQYGVILVNPKSIRTSKPSRARIHQLVDLQGKTKGDRVLHA